MSADELAIECVFTLTVSKEFQSPSAITRGGQTKIGVQVPHNAGERGTHSLQDNLNGGWELDTSSPRTHPIIFSHRQPPFLTLRCNSIQGACAIL